MTLYKGGVGLLPFCMPVAEWRPCLLRFLQEFGSIVKGWLWRSATKKVMRRTAIRPAEFEWTPALCSIIVWVGGFHASVFVTLGIQGSSLAANHTALLACCAAVATGVINVRFLTWDGGLEKNESETLDTGMYRVSLWKVLECLCVIVCLFAVRAVAILSPRVVLYSWDMLPPQPTQCWALNKKSTNQEKSGQSVYGGAVKVTCVILSERCVTFRPGRITVRSFSMSFIAETCSLPSNFTPKPDIVLSWKLWRSHSKITWPDTVVENLHPEEYLL